MNHDDLPPVLYKFRRWDKNGKPGGLDHRILTHLEAYFASPKDFNDPFDGKLGLGIEAKPTAEIISYAQKLTRSPEEFDNFKRGLEQDRASFLLDIRARLETLFAARTGVLCLSPDSTNILLWSHYAGGHKGFCVGLDSRWLADESVPDPTDLIIDHEQVKYESDYPQLNPFLSDEEAREWLAQQYRYKSASWNYENEYRFVMIRIPKLNDSDRILKLSPKSIREVILGCSIEAADEIEIKERVLQIAQLNPAIRLFRAKRSLVSFAVDIVPERLE
jgi:hypothetical protein